MKTNPIEDIDVIELPTKWPVGPVNLFLIKGEKLTLVDAGRKLDEAWTLFHDALRELDLTIMDIEQVVLTHHHTDHIGLLDWILERNPIPVYAHPNCRPFLSLDKDYSQHSRTFFETFFRENGVPEWLTEKLSRRMGSFRIIENQIDNLIDVNEGDHIPGLSEWEIVETKGHSQSHISLYRPRDQVFLSGDHLIKHIPAGLFLDAPVLPETVRAKPLLQYMNNLKKCLSLPIAITLSGHGEPIEDTEELIHKNLEKIEKRASKVKKLLYSGRKNAFQLVQELYPNRYDQDTPGLLSDITAFFDLLIERREVVEERDHGVLYYSINENQNITKMG